MLVIRFACAGGNLDGTLQNLPLVRNVRGCLLDEMGVLNFRQILKFVQSGKIGVAMRTDVIAHVDVPFAVGTNFRSC